MQRDVQAITALTVKAANLERTVTDFTAGEQMVQNAGKLADQRPAQPFPPCLKGMACLKYSQQLTTETAPCIHGRVQLFVLQGAVAVVKIDKWISRTFFLKQLDL
jgi:hypothetical protein